MAAILVAAAPACGGSARAAGWRALPPATLAPASSSVQVAALLAAGPGWPWLLGGDTRSGPAPSVGFWRSPDTTTWTPSAATGLTLDAPQNLVFSIAHRGGVFVALGETPGQAHGNPRPTIWRATDAGTWTEVPTLREDFGGPRLADLRAVTAGPLGFAVVGNWKADDGRPVIAVWLSDDGWHWVRHDHIAELTSREGEELTAMGIAGGGPGLAVVGESFHPTATSSARVEGFLATSVDGLTWRRVPATEAGLDNGGGQVAVRQVVADGDSLVAFGTRAFGPRNEVAAWRLAPGGEWTVKTVAAAGFVQATSMAVDGRTTLAAVADDGAARIWASGPDDRWRSVPAPPVTGADNVLLGEAGGRTVLVSHGPQGATVWVRSAFRLRP